MELLLEEERVCLERHKKELAVRRSCILYLESVTAEPEFAEHTQWRSKLSPLSSGHLGESQTRRGQELLAETDLLTRGNVP